MILSCTNLNNDSEEGTDVKKMLDSYIDKAKDKSISKEDKISALSNALFWSAKLPEDAERRVKQSEIAYLYYGLKEYDQYKNVNQKALNLSRRIRDSFGIAKSLSNIGAYYEVSNVKDSAFYYYVNAEKAFNKFSQKFPEDHGIPLFNKGVIQRSFKDYVGSEASMINAIEKFKESKNNLYIYYCYTYLGVLSTDVGRYDEAIKNYQNALDYARKIDNGKFIELNTLNNIGVVFKDQGRYKEAIGYYEDALNYVGIAEKYPKFYARLLDNIAYARFLSGDSEGVIDSFKKSLQIRDSLSDKSGLITCNLHIAEYYNSLNVDSVANGYAIKAKEIAESVDSKKDLLKSLLLLKEVSSEEKGLAYANHYIRLNDSLQNQERLNRDKFARIRFETDEIAEQNLQISRENEILIIAILGLTALFLLGYIIFRQQQSNKELLFAQTQQEANQEIYRLLLNQQIKLEEGRKLEQQRMSEELHDGVLGRLFGVRLSLDGINQRANDGFTEARNKYIDELKDIEKEIRLISHDLSSETLPSDVAYIDAVENLISDLCEINNIRFEFNNDEEIDWEHIDDEKKVNLFRILQESLQNIFKHASAKSIKINFDYIEDKINLTILDDGIGFNSTKVKKGIGLKNITSRVSQMSGVVQFLSNKDAGTQVSVSVPV
ncbi:sensor histidine kinase [Aquimarina gracilis]|uniref:histidine kinase n=1 Tax=Aquimarina gracilis TaxID=874422 RepID=A0ABU5ZV57_9FLAO|nr:sensor histidine kinase [Aquimarina gracilis]MEB3345904.1 sensor histidine kinase [Aquimarina gracilis]